jgi:hypothetical protein
MEIKRLARSLELRHRQSAWSESRTRQDAGVSDRPRGNRPRIKGKGKGK